MKSSVLALLCITSAVAYYDKSSNVSTGICSYESTCSANGYEGACVSISSGCCSGGTVTSGLCPGDSDIKCCTTPSCSTPSGSGSCMSTSECSAAGGNSVSGYCAGPSDLQCCVKSICDYEATCSAGGYEGACVSISSGCCSGGTVTSGLCPGDSDIKCCTAHACSTPYGSGTCMQTSACSGTSVAGYCTGPSDLQCCLGSTPSTTTYGVDVSTTITSDAAACMVSSGISYVIPRGYESIGDIDYRVCNSLTAAANAGIPTRDVYLFPCPTCSKSASTQMGELVSYLRSNCPSQWSGRVWLDIEGTDYWTGDYGANQNWFMALKDSCSAWGVSCGIYSSYYQWESIFGSISFVYGNELPLWYAHYDDNPSFSDFTAFGGWSSPHAKQYSGTSTVCGMGVDQNYSPSF